MREIYYDHIIEVTDDDSSYRYRVDVDEEFAYVTYEEWDEEIQAFLPTGEATQIPTHLAMRIADAIKELGKEYEPKVLNKLKEY